MAKDANLKVIDNVDESTLAVREPAQKHLYAESGRLMINASSGVVRIQPRFADSQLGQRARQRAAEATSKLFVVIIAEDGREYRGMMPFCDVELSIKIDQIGAFEAHALLITGESANFADANLTKRDLDTGEYATKIVKQSAGSGHELMKLAELTHCIPFKAESFELADEQFEDWPDTRFTRWCDLWWSNTPRTFAEKWVRMIIACSVQPVVMTAYMVLKAAFLSLNGLRHSVLFASRDFDWGAITDPSYSRAEQAGHKCKPFTRTRQTADRNEEVQADFFTIVGAPIMWWPMVTVSWFLNGGLVALFTEGSLMTTNPIWFAIFSAVLIVASGAAFLKIPNNDHEIQPVWEFLMHRFGRFLRNFRVSNLPGMRQLRLGDSEASIVDALTQKQGQDIENLEDALSLGVKLRLWINRTGSEFFKPVRRHAPKPAESETSEV